MFVSRVGCRKHVVVFPQALSVPCVIMSLVEFILADLVGGLRYAGLETECANTHFFYKVKMVIYLVPTGSVCYKSPRECTSGVPLNSSHHPLVLWIYYRGSLLQLTSLPADPPLFQEKGHSITIWGSGIPIYVSRRLVPDPGLPD